MTRAQWHDEFERVWRFPVPAAYVTLAERKAFDLPQPSGTYKQLINRQYLWVPDMEWRPFPDLLNPKAIAGPAKPGFASFAFSGGGDDWCWYGPAAVDGRVPVLECSRDDIEATFYAPDFILAVYRRILEESLAGFGCDDAAPVERQYLKRWSNDLGPLLPKPAAATLQSLHPAPVKEFTYGQSVQKGLITPEELDALIQRDLQFDQLGQQIQWAE